MAGNDSGSIGCWRECRFREGENSPHISMHAWDASLSYMQFVQVTKRPCFDGSLCYSIRRSHAARAGIVSFEAKNAALSINKRYSRDVCDCFNRRRAKASPGDEFSSNKSSASREVKERRSIISSAQIFVSSMLPNTKWHCETLFATASRTKLVDINPIPLLDGNKDPTQQSFSRELRI